MTFINATQFSGVAAFGIAAICSGCNWRAARYDRKQWGLMTIVTAMMAAECWIGIRHRVHAVATDLLVAHNLYGARNLPQKYLTAALAAAGCVLIALIVARAGKQSAACRSAWLATIVSLILFMIETVSLHSFDAVLYRPLGPVAVIGWLWMLSGLAISCSALAESRQRPA